jgi:hypothetical protein
MIGQYEAIPVCCGPDLRWRELLRLAFLHQVRIVVAPPNVILGLAKLSRFTKTPLYIRHVIAAGSQCPGWMEKAIISSLDCHIYGLETEADNSDAMDPLAQLPAYIGTWTSVLDCSITKSENGLEIEIVAFPGEMLPKLPSCARLVVRHWEPEKDIPFCIRSGWMNLPVTE